MALPNEPDPLLEEAQRLFERQISALEPRDAGLELGERHFEGPLAHWGSVERARSIWVSV